MNNLTTQIKNINIEIESLVIATDEQLENANALAKKCNELIKEVKASHKEEISKYHKLHKEAVAKEKNVLEPLNKGKDILKKAIGSYMKEREAKMLEIKKLQEEEQSMFGVVVTESQDDINLGGTHVRKIWVAKVLDESKVPNFYKHLMLRPVDMKLLNEIAKQEQGQAKIEGVCFYQVDSVVIR